jgi:fumarylpyruvate hydrolase
MMWTVPRTISHISKYFELFPGDLIYTGTPEGVGPIEKGDTMHGGIEGLGEFVVKVI